MQQETNKKYIILENETLGHKGYTLFRIKALKDFSDVKKGEKGGWIESESNLSQEGNCWVYGDSKVFNNAEVHDNAKVFTSSEVYGNAKVYGCAYICDRAKIYGKAEVSDKAKIFDDVEIFGNAQIYGVSCITNNVKIYDEAKVYDNARIKDNAQVLGNAEIYGEVVICNDAVIKEFTDFIVFKNHWSSGRYFIYTKSNKMWKVGCFYGTGDELIKKAYQDSELSGKMYEKYVNFVKELETR